MAADGSQREHGSRADFVSGAGLSVAVPGGRRTDGPIGGASYGADRSGSRDRYPARAQGRPKAAGREPMHTDARILILGPNDRLRTFNPDFGSCIHRNDRFETAVAVGIYGPGSPVVRWDAYIDPSRRARRRDGAGGTIDDSRRDRDGRDSARRPETCVRGGFAAGARDLQRRDALARTPQGRSPAGRGCPVWRLRRCDRGRARSASGWAGPASFRERAPGTRPFGIGSRRTKSGSHGIPGSKPYENLRPFDLKDCR